MLGYILRPLAWLPLSWLHACGVLAGQLVYRLSRDYAARLDDNLKQSALARDAADFERLRRAAIAEAGKTALELVAVWLSPLARLDRLVREVDGYTAVESAQRAGRGILFLTPHLGCFEIAALHFGQSTPLTVMYRPPRTRWLEPLMIRGRKRGRVQLATTDISGVRRFLRALRRGEAVGLLPDQAPRFGEGVWAPFFGRPAYTITLANRLRRATGCATFMVFAERLPRGAGYRIHIDPLPAEVHDETDLNRAIERAIGRRPEQYLWGYDRYKVPQGATPPAARARGGEALAADIATGSSAAPRDRSTSRTRLAATGFPRLRPVRAAHGVAR